MIKKIISLALVLVLALGLCACNKTPAPEAPTFRVGFGRVNITPSSSTGLQMEGYNEQISEGVLTYMFATCVAITDQQDNTLLLYTVDKCEVQKETVDALRSRLSESHGIPADNITVSGTHTHSSPVTKSMPDYVNQLVRAGEEALADRAAATISVGSYDVPDMNFVRHYILNDGTICGDNFGNSAVGYKDYASEVDKTMRLIRFVREGDKKDVLMVNWQAHPKLASTADTTEGRATRNLLSADFVGFARDYVETQNSDVLFAYYNGASGNVNPFSKLEAYRNIVTKDAKKYGEQLGGHVLTALEGLQPLEAGSVGSQKAPLGSRGFELHAYTVGDIGFATVPAEIFCATGMQIRDGSECDITFVLTVANGRDTYIPTEDVWDYVVANGDTPYEARICRYPQGTAEELAQSLVSMLNDLHN